MATATLARIRRCIRDSEFASAQNQAVIAARPDAKPQGRDDFTVDSFFDLASHAQVMLNERFSFQSGSHLSEAAEVAEPLSIGADISVTPNLPLVRMIDATRSIDRTMIAKGIAIDMQTERNSVEATG